MKTSGEVNKAVFTKHVIMHSFDKLIKRQ